MTNSLAGAKNVLASARESLTQASGELIAVADGTINDVKELVRAVFAAGFELDGLNEVIGKLEELENKVRNELVEEISGIRSKIEQIEG